MVVVERLLESLFLGCCHLYHDTPVSPQSPVMGAARYKVKGGEDPLILALLFFVLFFLQFPSSQAIFSG
jgi:hypothetical protein